MSELSEKGIQEANQLVENFKKRMAKVAEQTISDLYCNIMPHIETDSWLNYREQLRLEVQNKYVQKETCTSEECWAKEIRAAIYIQFKEELRDGIIRDLEEKIDKLKADLSRRDWL